MGTLPNYLSLTALLRSSCMKMSKYPQKPPSSRLPQFTDVFAIRDLVTSPFRLPKPGKVVIDHESAIILRSLEIKPSTAKILVDNIGRVTNINDGDTILRTLEIEPPAAKE